MSFATISIHAAREGGDLDKLSVMLTDVISIHAAREGGDAVGSVIMLVLAHISIHAAREGGDCLIGQTLQAYENFNPRRP